ncbi:COG1361 family protein [Streptomyces vinaceus]|uniref:hypothetical protein n=1 Tax=Streptomyces vinaceus TaxID=1960 RepID=UPI0036C4207B
MDVLAAWALAVSAMGLIASAVAVNYSRRQALASSEQALAAREQVVAAQQQVQAAQDQVNAANRQVDVALRQVEIAEMAQREASQPYVVVDIRPRTPGSSLLTLTIENLGVSLARDVRISIDPPLRSGMGAEHDSALATILQNPISHIPPRSAIKYSLGVSGPFISDESIEKVYRVSVNATGPYGPVGELSYLIDLRPLGPALLERESLEWSVKRLADAAEKQVKS